MESRVLASLPGMCSWTRQDFPHLPRLAARALELIRVVRTPELRVSAAIPLMGHLTYTCESEVADGVLRIVDSVLRSEHVSAVNAVRWHGTSGYVHYVRADFARAMRDYDQARDLARAHGLHQFDFYTANQRGLCAWRMGDFASLTATLQEFDDIAGIESGVSDARAIYQMLSAVALCARGSLGEACRVGNAEIGRASCRERV